MRLLKYLPLALTSAALVRASTAWWNRIPPLGDDASSHIVAMSRVAEILSTRAGWWAPDFNLGFPVGLYYQPLPHAVGGALTWLLGGGTAAILAYKVISIALVALMPWCVAFGARRMGLAPAAAIAAGVAAPLVTSTLDFGLTVRSSLVLALHTQAWAALWLPLALGEVARTLDGHRRSAPWAILLCSLLCLSHFFYGVALAAVVLLWVLCRPREVLKRLGRACGLGLLVALTLAFWLIPLVAALPAAGGWPFGSAQRVDGYGWAGFFEPLVGGHLLDGDSGAPVLTVMAGVGLAICLRAAVRSVSARLVLTAVILSALFTVGRAGLGSLADVFFLNRSVQMFRYLGLFHLGAVWLVGWTVGEMVDLVRPLRGWIRVASSLLLLAILVALAVAPARRGREELRLAFRTIDDAGVDLTAYFGLTEAIRHETREHGSGRLFVHPRSGLHGHFHSALLALWSASDNGQSYGVGLHDSLNFYFLEFFHPELDRTATLTDLYGFQYLAADEEADFSAIGAEVVYDSGGYALWRLDHRIEMCSPIDVASIREDHPRAVRAEAMEWLRGNGPAAQVHPLLRIDRGLSSGGVTQGPVQVEGRTEVEDAPGSPGQVRMSQFGADWVDCRLTMKRPGAVLFKVSYHPYWQASVDGEPARLSYAYPAFAAVELEEGPHEVSIRYRLPAYQVWLVLAAPLPFLVAWVLGGRRRKACLPPPAEPVGEVSA